MKDSFTIYTKYAEQISLLSDVQAGVLLRALICYQTEKPLPKMDGMTNIIFTTIRQELDSEKEYYDALCEKNRANGKKGGRPSKSLVNKGNKPKKPNGYFGFSEKPKKANGFDEENISNKEERSKEENNTLKEKERKKEIDKDIISISACACETIPDFASMTDEELVAWGEERPVDFTDSDAVAFFEAWMEETAKREKEGKKWSGKITREGFERLKSHAEVMTECSVSNVFRKSLESFLRHCYANGHLVTNDKLMDIINRLDDACGSDDEAKCGYIQRAISGGFFDVIAGKFISPAEARK